MQGAFQAWLQQSRTSTVDGSKLLPIVVLLACDDNYLVRLE